MSMTYKQLTAEAEELLRSAQTTITNGGCYDASLMERTMARVEIAGVYARLALAAVQHEAIDHDLAERDPETAVAILTADVVCIRDDGFVLLIERGWPPYKGMLALPGGHQDPGETPEAAAVRELVEETGVVAAESDLIGVGSFGAPGRDPRTRYLTDAFAVKVAAGTEATAGDDAAAVRWVPISALGGLAFDHGEIVAAALTLVSGPPTA